MKKLSKFNRYQINQYYKIYKLKQSNKYTQKQRKYGQTLNNYILMDKRLKSLMKQRSLNNLTNIILSHKCNI